MKAGKMNKTEEEYAQRLDALKHAGEIAWYKFEGLRLRLGDGCGYTPDFAVMKSNGLMECHEVKGARAIFRDDAKVKVKVAAQMYPFRFIVVYPVPKKKGGGWEVEEF
jgi:hypothetical protein